MTRRESEQNSWVDHKRWEVRLYGPSVPDILNGVSVVKPTRRLKGTRARDTAKAHPSTFPAGDGQSKRSEVYPVKVQGCTSDIVHSTMYTTGGRRSDRASTWLGAQQRAAYTHIRPYMNKDMSCSPIAKLSDASC